MIKSIFLKKRYHNTVQSEFQYGLITDPTQQIFIKQLPWAKKYIKY